MRSHNEIEVMLPVELLNNVCPKGERYTSIALSPSTNIGIWICPKNIAKQASIWNVGGTQNTTNLFHAVQIRRQSSMYAKNLIINNRSNGETIENHIKCFPELQAVTALAFVIKPVDAIDRRAFMISSQHEKVLRVLDLVGEEQTNTFQSLRPSIDIVSKKQIVCFRWESAIFEQAQQIRILSMNVTYYLQWRFELKQNWLCHKNFPCLCN
mmetsp:Transcript_22412/g.50494  ORF Transcript_22412/g.50494 Transcript_22412/m.50494 type:complete len:211 (-) Transcript_22412:221-853(-)